jgi:hypothetical protein
LSARTPRKLRDTSPISRSGISPVTTFRLPVPCLFGTRSLAPASPAGGSGDAVSPAATSTHPFIARFGFFFYFAFRPGDWRQRRPDCLWAKVSSERRRDLRAMASMTTVGNPCEHYPAGHLRSSRARHRYRCARMALRSRSCRRYVCCGMRPTC